MRTIELTHYSGCPIIVDVDKVTLVTSYDNGSSIWNRGYSCGVLESKEKVEIMFAAERAKSPRRVELERQLLAVDAFDEVALVQLKAASELAKLIRNRINDKLADLDEPSPRQVELEKRCEALRDAINTLEPRTGKYVESIEHPEGSWLFFGLGLDTMDQVFNAVTTRPVGDTDSVINCEYIETRLADLEAELETEKGTNQ